MRGELLLFVKLVIIFIGESRAGHCDVSTTAIVDEGILGQTPDFNWLGVLRVHLHDSDHLQIAVSGIVLVKMKHAIVNADDVVRVPQHVFQEDSKAMFIPYGDTPWYAKPVSYITHPEYEYATFNSIAVIEINFDDNEDYPLNPICVPSVAYNTSKYLYLTGYTDENQLLEKVIYKIQALDKHVCEEFYNRAGLSAKNKMPTSYICGFAPSNVSHCVWDNGMVLVSNATGYFNLIGFGVRGPGCAAPARFIDLFSYFPWINSVTSNVDMYYDAPDYRRDISKEKEEEIEFIPIHDLFRSNASRRQNDDFPPPDVPRDYIPYPFEVDKINQFTIVPVEDNAIAIFPFNDTLEVKEEACRQPRVIIYREHFELVMEEGLWGTTTYKITLYDLKHYMCSCVQLTVTCKNRSEAIFSFKEEIDFDQGVGLSDPGATPLELFRYFPIYKRTPKPNQHDPGEAPYSDLEPYFIKDETKLGSVLNYDLYIKFEFKGRALLEFKLLAAPEVKRPTVQPDRRTDVDSNGTKNFYGYPIKMVKEPEIELVAELEEVQETVSKGHCSTIVPVVLVLGNLILCYLSLSRVLSI